MELQLLLQKDFSSNFSHHPCFSSPPSVCFGYYFCVFRNLGLWIVGHVKPNFPEPKVATAVVMFISFHPGCTFHAGGREPQGGADCVGLSMQMQQDAAHAYCIVAY